MNDAKRDVNIILCFVFLVRRSTENTVSPFILFSHSFNAGPTEKYLSRQTQWHTCSELWPSCFCQWAPSVRPSALSLWLPGSAAETPPSSPAPACALWWPRPVGQAEHNRMSRKRKMMSHGKIWCGLNELYISYVFVRLGCTSFALCWSSPCLSLRALSMSKTSWVLSSSSLWVSL